MKRKTITLEIDEVTVIRRRKKTLHLKCEVCSEEAQMVTLDEAAALGSSSAKEILGLVSDGKVHFAQLSGGVLLVCVKSLCDANKGGAGNQSPSNS